MPLQLAYPSDPTYPVHCMTCRRVTGVTTVEGSTGLCAACLGDRLRCPECGDLDCDGGEQDCAAKRRARA